MSTAPMSRRRRALLAVVVSVLASLAVGQSVGSARAGFVATISDTNNSATSGVLRCNAAAAAASPYFIYPFADATGASSAADTSGNARPGTYSATGVTYGVAGPCTVDGGRAVALDGATGAVTGASFALTLLSFSEAVWFKTSATTGGLLVSVGDTSTGPSTLHDRALYLSDNGALNFEVQPTLGPAVITSPGTYRDGAWHLAVATFSATAGMVLYVDGAAVRSNAGVTTALALGVVSYWRLGYDTVAGIGTTAPSNAHFTGALAYASVYTYALSASQVANLYAAGS